MVEVLLLVAVVGLLAGGGWYVLQRKRSNPQSGSIVQQDSQKSEDTSVEPGDKAGWKTVSQNGLVISYPEAWDNTQEDYQRLKVGGKVENNVVYGGFGSSFGYNYLGQGGWEYVDGGGNKVDDSKPKAAPAGVVGADATIILSGGDGGCGGNTIGFAYKGGLYSVSLPWECDVATHGSAGIAGDVVTKDLAEVIKSIKVQ